MDYLRQGIHLRGYAQKQPKQEYKRESFELFSEMLDKVKFDITSMLARVRVRDEDEVAEMEAADRRRHEQQAAQMNFQHPNAGGPGADEELAEMGVSKPAMSPKVGRNDPCPCGSGKKFKQCHGQLG
jgi:preprotein translocase subunit SecA